jgi:hypothetical protein
MLTIMRYKAETRPRSVGGVTIWTAAAATPPSEVSNRTGIKRSRKRLPVGASDVAPPKAARISDAVA